MKHTLNLKGKKIGYAITGSFCTAEAAITIISKLVADGAEVTPIISNIVESTDTRFTKHEKLKETLINLTNNQIIDTIVKAEPIGPNKLFDLIIVAPCTGNTLAKLAHGITDTTVTMAVKSHIRNNSPVLLGVSTNDGLGVSAKNIGELINMKNYYFIPFYQDNPEQKPKSLAFKKDLIVKSAEAAISGRQVQPILTVAEE